MATFVYPNWTKLGSASSLDTLEPIYITLSNEVAIRDASIAQKGAVQLISDTTNKTSETLATNPKYVNDAIAGAITSAKSFRGGWDASSNLYPSTGGSGTAGAILAGDMWVITADGVLSLYNVVIGDTILALVDNPGQDGAKWFIDTEQLIIRQFYIGTIFKINHLAVDNGVIWKCLIDNTQSITPSNSSPNWLQITEFDNGIRYISESKGIDNKAPWIPSKTIPGAQIAFPGKEFILLPGSYISPVGDVDGIHLRGLFQNRTFIDCINNPLNITNGNISFSLSDLTILRYTSASVSHALKFSGNIGDANHIKNVAFAAFGAANSQPMIMIDGVTSGKINIYDAIFYDNETIIEITNATTACNLNLYDCKGTIRIKCAGIANVYAENCTVVILNNDHIAGNINFNNCAIAPAGLTSNAEGGGNNSITLQDCNAYTIDETDGTIGYAPIAINGCQTIINGGNIDYNNFTSTFATLLLGISNDTNKTKRVNSTSTDTVQDVLEMQDRSIIYDLSLGSVDLNIAYTGDYIENSMTIREFKLIIINNAGSNTLNINATAPDVILGYTSPPTQPQLNTNSTLQINFKTHEIVIY